MSNKYLITTVCVFLMYAVSVGTCLGGDLDDGISKYKDDPISKYDEIGKSDVNVKFIIMSAMSKAKAGKGSTNENSVVVYGSNSGTIINVVETGKGKGKEGSNSERCEKHNKKDCKSKKCQ